jgi:hypothetical protein
VQINIESNVKQLSKQLSALENKVLPKATNRSLNRVGGKVNTQVLRYVSKKVGQTQKMLKHRGFFARVNSNIKTLTTQVRVVYGAIPMKDFNPRQTKQGVTAKAWGKRKVYKDTFIVEELGHHVFVRKGKERLPIKKVYGANPASVAKSAELALIVNKVIADNLGSEMKSNIRYFANKEHKKMSAGLAGGYAKVL